MRWRWLRGGDLRSTLINLPDCHLAGGDRLAGGDLPDQSARAGGDPGRPAGGERSAGGMVLMSTLPDDGECRAANHARPDRGR